MTTHQNSVTASYSDEGYGPAERLLHETRREAHYWFHQANLARMGRGDYSYDEAQKQLHASLENYWNLLKTPVEEIEERHKNDTLGTDDNIPKPVELWRNEAIFQNEQGVVNGLASLRDWWVAETVEQETKKSVLHGTETVERRRVPVLLKFQQARKVLHRLDELAARLGVGFDANLSEEFEYEYDDLLQ